MSLPPEQVQTVPAKAPQPRTLVIDNLIAVASGKGGVGKTWFSATLAHTIAHSGKRVLLVDGDLGLANIDVQLGLTPEHDLVSVVTGQVDAEKAVTRFAGGADHCRKGGFDVLAGRSGSGTLSTLASSELLALGKSIHRLSAKYDTVILDLGAGLDGSVRLLCGAASETLVVLTDEPTSLTDAYALIKVLWMRSGDIKTRAVINMAESAAHGRRTFKALSNACRNFLGREPELAGIIRRDKAVKDAIRQQMPLLSRSPQCAAAEDVAAIAETVK